MKKLITLGIALLAYVSDANAETTLVQGVNANAVTSAAVKAQQFENLLTEKSGRPKFAPVEDKTVLIPETVIASNYQRSIEDVIAEDNKIIESIITDEGYVFLVFETSTEDIIAQDNKIIESDISTDVRPLYLERTIEDVIAEDNAIIEGNVPNQIMELNFSSINKNSVLAEN